LLFPNSLLSSAKKCLNAIHKLAARLGVLVMLFLIVREVRMRGKDIQLMAKCGETQIHWVLVAQ
jgi:hypothetical protein